MAAEVVGEPLGALEAPSVALLLSGQQGGEIAGAATWTTLPGPDGDDRRHVVVLADLDGASLLAGEPGPGLVLVALGYALSEQGEVGGQIAQGFRVPGGRLIEQVRERGMKIVAPISLPDGRWSLRFVVRNVHTGRFGLARMVVELPSPGGRRPWLEPPLAAEPEGGWVLGRASDLTLLPRVGPQRRLPTAFPTAVLGQPLGLELRGDLERGSPIARLVDGLGREVEELPLATRATGPSTVEAILTASDVLPGHYGLVVTVPGAVGAPGASQRVPIAVVDRLPPPSPVVFDAAVAEDALRAAERMVASLAVLAEGDEVAALHAVAALERAVWRHGGTEGLRRLHGAESGRLLALGRERSQVLLPVAVLYRRLAREYREPGEEPLSLHAWSLAADLADVLAELGPEGRELAAAVQVALARDLALAGNEAFAADLMRRALRHLPAEPEVLLGLAALEERRGHSEEAVGLLARCLRVAPESWEARLRLGVNLGRTRRYQEADETLALVAADPGAPAWARAVAYQERARALAEAGRSGPALAAVRDGRAALPADQQLGVLEAMLLDGLGDLRAGAAAAAGITPAADPLAPSPRMRYMSAPAVGLELWEAARRRASQLLDELAAALAAGGAGREDQPSQPG